LCGRGYPETEVAGVLDALQRQNLLSDERFTEAFTHSRRQHGKGPLRIRAELRARGLDEALIDRYVDGVSEPWFEVLRSVHDKKFGATLPADFAERARRSRFLLYRGFSAEQIRHLFEGGE
jgi:regulatory protein